MISRRHFIRTAGVAGMLAVAPPIARLAGFSTIGFSGTAHAAQIETADFSLPSTLPQVINIFLYGGASELAGNLTNIERISALSQNRYPDDLLQLSDGETGEVTRNGFWRSAGGDAMEDMLAYGDMSVYRTINRRKNNTRAHRQSIFSSQKGSLSIDSAGGMGSTIAAVLQANESSLNGSEQLNGRTLDELVLPFVSFEGSSIAFAQNTDQPLPLRLRGLSLDEQFDNPYSRDGGVADSELRDLILQVQQSVGQNGRFAGVRNGFVQRRNMEELIGNLQMAADNPLPVVPSDDPAFQSVADPDSGRLRYPEDSRFSSRVKAAVTLAISNPDTRFISLGGGLSGWDDHDSSLDTYVPRMRELMESLQVAIRHIRYAGAGHGGLRDTSNIIINVHGDFGRNVNLNNSAGWDHGNNQNLYTFGGSGIRVPGALGKIVGTTEVFGDASQNRLFTRPADSSYEVEPMSIAASTYSYFGVRNPRALTHDPTYNTEGDDVIDESVSGVPLI